ncbi:MAG TPA: GNAT family N-acetyltransferase [Pyrinomonadaceae bacterium]|nr:GNAT family N-acetyltransferase [Pyrinomonadaceae bacterium]
MNPNFRPATIKDLPAIVRMLADDFLGSQRERYEEPLPESYLKAFAEIDSSPNNELIVAEIDGEVIGTMQLTFIPNIAFQGGKRMLIESVRVDSKLRGQGIGKKFMEFAINRAKEKDCLFVQLTTAADRTDAHRFYKDLGFTASHVGMKLRLK